jgi:serpin B
MQIMERQAMILSTTCRAGLAAMLALFSLGASATDIPPVTKADQSTISAATPNPAGKAVNGQALETFAALLKSAGADADILLAPSNLYGLVALLAQGADGETRKRLGASLGTGDEVAAAAQWIQDLEAALAAAGQGGAVLRSATGVWVSPGIRLRDTFREVAGSRFGARVDSADLSKPETIAAINAWAAERTQGRIKDLLPAGGSEAALVAVAAIAFDGRWDVPFDPSRTADGAFTVASGASLTVPLMARDFTATAYHEGSGVQAIILPYGGGELDMTIVLPPVGEAPSREALAAWLDRTSFVERNGTLTLPRFTARTSMDLTVVKGIDWIAALTQTPDLSRLADGVGAVDRFIHTVAVTVDEQGTQAAGASAATVSRNMPASPVVMTVNRPFLFFVRHRPSDAILFAGHVVKPSAP